MLALFVRFRHMIFAGVDCLISSIASVNHVSLLRSYNQRKAFQDDRYRCALYLRVCQASTSSELSGVMSSMLWTMKEEKRVRPDGCAGVPVHMLSVLRPWLIARSERLWAWCKLRRKELVNAGDQMTDLPDTQQS